MRNRRPIIVNGFERGGTNIVVNMLLSSPDVVYPSGELDRVFYGGNAGGQLGRLRKRIWYGWPAALLIGRSYFRRFNYAPRMPLSPTQQVLIDWTLFREKLRTDVELAVREGKISYEGAGRLLEFYEEGLQGYTYLEDPKER